MRSTEDRLFAAVCYLALTDDHGYGWARSAHPEYLMEKLSLFDGNPDFAMGSLDGTNQQRVLNYYKFWKLELPTVIQEWVDHNKGRQQRSIK